MAIVAAEMLVGDVGFGYRIRLQSKLLNMSVVYPYLALLAALLPVAAADFAGTFNGEELTVTFAASQG